MAGLFKSKKQEMKFPDTLLGFGYEFSKDGKIQNVKTGDGFQFAVKEDQSYNQKHYEALGEVVTQEVYKLLEIKCQLRRAPVPHDAAEGKAPSTFVFLSHDALTNPDKLLVLIHGSGVVRAGQWSRRLIINDSLKSGSQIPFIQEAQKEGYGILVMNTNDNYRPGEGKIKGSENPECHAFHVWRHYVQEAMAKHIAIVAHSYGGCVTTSLYTQVKEDFTRRVFAVAMTDSVHYLPNPKAFVDLAKMSRNWVCSQHPLDTPVNTQSGDITRVSAGVTVHEQTSWASFTSIFRFLQERLAAVKGSENGTAGGDGEKSAGGGGGGGRGKANEAKDERESDAKLTDEDAGGRKKSSHGVHSMSEEEEEEEKKEEVEDKEAGKKMRMDT